MEYLTPGSGCDDDNDADVRYHERERIIRASDKAGRWAAFMSFLNELYGLVRSDL